MQVVIDIDEEMYKDANILIVKDFPILKKAIAKGIPLPKGHGRLVDADAILEDPYGNTYKDINIAETIIEADKEK